MHWMDSVSKEMWIQSPLGGTFRERPVCRGHADLPGSQGLNALAKETSGQAAPRATVHEEVHSLSPMETWPRESPAMTAWA